MRVHGNPESLTVSKKPNKQLGFAEDVGFSLFDVNPTGVPWGSIAKFAMSIFGDDSAPYPSSWVRAMTTIYSPAYVTDEPYPGQGAAQFINSTLIGLLNQARNVVVAVRNPDVFDGIGNDNWSINSMYGNDEHGWYADTFVALRGGTTNEQLFAASQIDKDVALTKLQQSIAEAVRRILTASNIYWSDASKVAASASPLQGMAPAQITDWYKSILSAAGAQKSAMLKASAAATVAAKAAADKAKADAAKKAKADAEAKKVTATEQAQRNDIAKNVVVDIALYALNPLTGEFNVPVDTNGFVVGPWADSFKKTTGFDNAWAYEASINPVDAKKRRDAEKAQIDTARKAAVDKEMTRLDQVAKDAAAKQAADAARADEMEAAAKAAAAKAVAEARIAADAANAAIAKANADKANAQAAEDARKAAEAARIAIEKARTATDTANTASVVSTAQNDFDYIIVNGAGERFDTAIRDSNGKVIGLRDPSPEWMQRGAQVQTVTANTNSTTATNTQSLVDTDDSASDTYYQTTTLAPDPILSPEIIKLGIFAAVGVSVLAIVMKNK